MTKFLAFRTARGMMTMICYWHYNLVSVHLSVTLFIVAKQ